MSSKRHKKVFTTLNYTDYFLVWDSTINGCISISAFISFIVIPIATKSSAIALKICAITV